MNIEQKNDETLISDIYPLVTQILFKFLQQFSNEINTTCYDRKCQKYYIRSRGIIMASQKQQLVVLLMSFSDVQN